MAFIIHPLGDYPYAPLSSNTQCIRLIQLKPRSYQSNQSPSNSILCCELIHATRGQCQSYTALSYSWGKQIGYAALNIGGLQYYVNATVEAALRQIQADDSDVSLWIDQICINQKDDEEKSFQVQQMRQIYSEADCVVAWLGTAQEDSNMLLKHIGRIGQFIWAGEHDRLFSIHQGKEVVEAIAGAFRRLCEREYWKRLWILQEYAVATRLRILCGEVDIWDWQIQAVLVFVNKLSQIDRFGGRSDHLAAIARNMVQIYKTSSTSFMEGVVTRRTRYWNQEKEDRDPLFRILVTTLVLEHDYNQLLTSDPRDRVFSLLNLAKDGDEFTGFPDYKLSCDEVYVETALVMLKQGNIDLLSYCQFSKVPSGMPTWVPDWRLQIRSPCTGPPWLNGFSASLDSLEKQVLISPDPQTIELQGFLVETIEECGTLWDPNWSEILDYHAALSYIEQIQALCAKSPRFLITEEAEGAASRIAIASGNPQTGKEITEQYSKALQNVIKELTSERSSSKDQKPEDDIINSAGEEEPSDSTWSNELLPFQYLERLRLLHSQVPFISKTGYVGLAKWPAQPGDHICIFLGARVPYVIRPFIDGTLDTFMLIGDAYVHGAMQGELFHSEPEINTLKLR